MPVFLRSNGSLVRAAPMFNSSAHAISYLRNQGHLAGQTKTTVRIKAPTMMSNDAYVRLVGADNAIAATGKTIRYL